MDIGADFRTYQDKITSSLVSVTRTASQISNQDLGFHRSSSDKFSKSLDSQSTHLLRLTNKLLKAVSKDTSIKVPALQNSDGIDDNWRHIVDVVDDLLEKADRSLDEFTGVIKRLSPARQDGAENIHKKQKQGQALDQWSQSSIPKPQLLFDKKVNNYDNSFWKPLLSEKPHANMPLEDSIGTGEHGFKHPYAHEIQNMIYPNSTYQIADPVPFSPPEASQPIFVDTIEGVHEMLAELKLAKEIAIDLEHNEKNSYIGLVCLMQISTRDKDWIVDTLKPWREDLQILNEVFANPRIVKVLHGANSDIIWLQRDLGLYIVGLFDTYHASNALQFPAKSLKYLLQRFADFEAQKQYQLADWRIRPLPQELIDYARSDTHFLLFIYDNLRNMLLEASGPRENLLDHVLDASRREALQVYERPVYDAENGLNQGGWMKMLLQRASQLTNEQLGVFRAVHHWRDNKARELDEGDQNIMPISLMWTIAETMPTRRTAFFQRGVGRLPRYVAENIPEIIEVVKQGISQGKDGPSVHELIEKHGNKAGFMFGRNKYIRKKVEAPNHGVGATLQLLNESGQMPTTHPSTEPLISQAAVSQLWKNVETLSASTVANPNIILQALESILPFYNTEVKELGPSDPSPRNVEVVVQAVPNGHTNGILKDDKDEIFIVKERSKKRKASDALSPELETPVPAQPDLTEFGNDIIDVSVEAPDSGPNLSKRQAKLAKKAEKRAKKAADAQERAAAQANMVPFDYSKAGSILHANLDSNQGEKVGGTKSKDKPLNPYAKALDTSTGARRNRMGKELAGKSHTFKN